jgi:hypothetical protein
VTVVQSGSYSLTSSLDLSAEGVNASGIAVSVPAVNINLRGFQIAGPTGCSGSGTTINCNPSSTGVGSAGVQFTINATAGVVQNGVVRNITNFGIFSQAIGLRVQDVSAIRNGRDGITAGQGALVVNSVAVENGQDGIDVNTGSVVDGVTAIGNGSNGIRGQGTASVVTRASVRNNGMSGFFLGLSYKFGKNNVSSGNGLADICGEGFCTDRKRIYLTKQTHSGNAVLSACTLGFHAASVADLLTLAVFTYDPVLGSTFADSGEGPPADLRGWVRTGFPASSTINCSAWTTTSGTGTLASFEPTYQGTGDYPILMFQKTCNSGEVVWCVESTK